MDFEFAAHGVDEAFADGEAQAGAFGAVAFGVSELEELVEDVFEVFGCDADAGVGDDELEGAVGVAGRADADFAGLGEFDGVADQVAEDAGELDAVGAEGHVIGGGIDLEGQALLAGEREQLFLLIVEERGEGELGFLKLDVIGIESGDIQHIAEEVDQGDGAGVELAGQFGDIG